LRVATKDIMNTLPIKSASGWYVQNILRWRWLIAGLVALVTVVVELHEGDIFDVIDLIYGLIVPATIWSLLTILASNLARRERSEARLEQHRRLTQQLAQHQDWGDLIQGVLRFSGAFLPVTHTSLFVDDYSNGRVQFVAGWNAADPQALPPQAESTFDACQACLRTKPYGLRRINQCRTAPDSGADELAEDYCLPLAYDSLRIGILKLRCAPSQALAPDQITFMNEVAPEIALALATALVRPQAMEEVRTAAQLDERRRIADELHDALAQHIGYLHLSLDRLARDDRLTAFGDVQQELEYGREAAKNAYAQIREIISIVRSWTTVDLTQAIADYSRQVASRASLVIDFAMQGKPILLPASVCQQIFSLVREGLNNVEKHAQARHAQIALSWSADSLTINLTDNGMGFDPASIPRGHFGLALMNERVNALGGELGLESTIGVGSRLSFRIPLAQPAARVDQYPTT
jgi:signal transduction histidine kinase